VAHEEALDHAAAALASAQAMRLPVCFADEADAEEGCDEVALIRDLRRAIEEGELRLFYQPKLRSRTNTIDSAEALLRWPDREGGPVSIERLIRLAESTGAIRDLTEWVVGQAVADQARLAQAGYDLTIYANISGVLLPDAGFARRVLGMTAAARSRIGFEVTETAVIGDPAGALANLHAFADGGIKIAIDDYGSGLSSLSYLKQLPAHELKIDRMFVSGLVDSHRDPLLVRSSIDLAHALDMEVTAEGVDDPMALSLLRVMGCDMVQGYLISHPLPIDGLERFLAEFDHRQHLTAPKLVVAGGLG
jgi:EAL domain-containing protein (putative c-di-GMP-specific phosphodiesterase class I)